MAMVKAVPAWFALPAAVSIPGNPDRYPLHCEMNHSPLTGWSL
jgi:hypothetical protein